VQAATFDALFIVFGNPGCGTIALEDERDDTAYPDVFRRGFKGVPVGTS
jgi:hypothetical protein